jgi:hypothetical protein
MAKHNNTDKYFDNNGKPVVREEVYYTVKDEPLNGEIIDIATLMAGKSINASATREYRMVQLEANRDMALAKINYDLPVRLIEAQAHLIDAQARLTTAQGQIQIGLRQENRNDMIIDILRTIYVDKGNQIPPNLLMAVLRVSGLD